MPATREQWKARNDATKQYRADRYSANREAEREKRRLYHLANPDAKWSYDLRSKYGLTVGAYGLMVDAQLGRCAICGGLERMIDTRIGRPRRMPVDHCHETGAIRGLLCSSCNRALGLMRDDPEVLQRAINYLKEPPMQQLVIGRRVYFWPTKYFADSSMNVFDPAQPCDAGVVFVHPSGNHVNLDVTDHYGSHHAVRNVPFGEESKGSEDADDAGGFADWMPFQKGASHTAVGEK